MTWSRALIDFFKQAFVPPFRTLPWIVLLYAVLSVVYNGDSHFNRWTLPDTDDYMRLNQMMGWVNGQSWFDLHIPRLYPQHIVTMHWGRLPDLLLASVYLVLKNLALFFKWETSQQAVAMLTAFFVPAILLGGLLLLMPAMARPVLGKRMANVTCFLVPLATQLIFQFMPMRVDHHAYILLSAGAAFLCLQIFALHLRPTKMMALAGVSLALGMWNGAEIIPMLVCFCLALTALVIAERRNFSGAAVFGFCLLAANTAILFIARAPDQRWSLEYDAFSFFYVLLAALVAGFFALLYGMSLLTRNRAVLSAVAVFIGLAGIALLLHAFPDFILGPYAKANPVLSEIFFPNIREAVPLYKSLMDVGDTFNLSPQKALVNGLLYISTRIFISLVGIATAFWLLTSKNTSLRQKRLWALYAFFASAYAILCLAWQVRVITYAQLFALVPMAALLLRCLKQLSQHYAGRKLFTLEVTVVLALTLVPVLLLPAILSQSRFMPDMLFYLGKNVDTPCNNRLPVISYFHDLYDRQKKPATIMAPMDYTPELLFYTQDNFISAPYHRNDRGIIDMVTFFRSHPRDEVAKAIARRLDLDYVLVCKASYFQGTLSHDREVSNMTITLNGNKTSYIPAEGDLKKASLGMRLAFEKIPDWLEERNVPLNSDFLLFEVKKSRLGGAKLKR